MVFNICTGVNDLYDEKRKQKYAIMIADTVIVRKEEGESITNAISKKFKDVSYQIDEGDVKPDTKKEPSKKQP